MSTNPNEFEYSPYQEDSRLDAALVYAKYGMKIIPICSHDHRGMSTSHLSICRNNGKVPIIKDWLARASSDPANITKWYEEFPEANVGIVLGSKTGIIAIDVDGDYGKKRLLEIFGSELPATWEFKTPGGGYRYLYKAPHQHSLFKFSDSQLGTLHQEIAFLGDGQQTLMPPSIHHNGGIYRWIKGKSPTEISLALAPAEMLEKMSRPGQVKQLTAKATIISLEPTSPSSNLLKELQGKCKQINASVDTQVSQGGCDEQRWFNTISLLVKIGTLDDAMSFSQLSSKHDEHSQKRIEEMVVKKDAFGPVRCTTLGCSADQIQKCFSIMVRNKQDELTNSPAAFLIAPAINRITIIEKLLDHTDYQLINGNLCVTSFSKEGVKSYKPIANFVAYFMEAISMDDGVEEEDYLLIEGMMLDNKQQLPPIRIKTSEFNDMKWIIKWGLRPNIQPGIVTKDKVRHAIQELAKEVKQTQVYSHLGFRYISDEWKYLHAGGCVGLDGVLVETDSRLDKYILPDKSISTTDSIHRSLALLQVAPIRVTLPLLATIFLAPLCEILRQMGIEPSFITWVYGLTGTRKSTLTALFLCHFGKFTAKSPPASFKDTTSSLEKRTSDCKDSVFWIDDYHPTNSPQEGKRMAQTAQSLLRSYGDRVGRGRMRKDTSLRPDYIPRGLAIVTGEQLPDGHSSNSRFVGIELNPDDVDLSKLSLAQQKGNDLSVTMKGYLEWLGKRMSDESFGKALLSTFEKNRDLALPLQTHGRLAETAAWLYIGIETFLNYVLSEKAIDSEYQTTMLTDGWDTLLSLSETQSEQVQETRPTSQFLSIVSSLLTNGTIYVLPADQNGLNQHDGMAHKGTHVGWSNKDYFYLMPDVIYNEVSKFLTQRNEQIPLKPSALWKQLETEQVLVGERYIEKDHQPKVKCVRGKNIDKKRHSTIWIKHAALEEIVSVSSARQRPQFTQASELIT